MKYYQVTRPVGGSFYGLEASGFGPAAGSIPQPHPIADDMDGPVLLPPPPVPQGNSSSECTNEENRTLLALRAMGKNWNQIQREAFPAIAANACRKRHKRLMERQGTSDLDNRKLERLSKEYMTMHEEI